MGGGFAAGDFRLGRAVQSVFQPTRFPRGLLSGHQQRIIPDSFGPQFDGISQGRLPDGSATILSFPGSVSPAAPNYINAYIGPVLNELMALNQSAVYDPRGNTPDWVEIYNPASSSYPLAGM